MSYKVLLIEKIDNKGIEILKKSAEVDISPDTSEETIIKIIGNYDAIVVRSSKITSKIIKAGKNLKVIGRHGIGTDNIDIDAATKAGIMVVNTPVANVNSVAEHAVSSMMYLSKRLNEVDRALRKGEFDQQGSLPGLVTKLNYTTLELEDKKLGLVGFGKIARRVAEICMQAFHMKVYAYDAFIPKDVISKFGATPCESIEEIFEVGDFISTHIPLTPETRGIVGEELINRMKPTAFIVNTARGGVINEKDLYVALKNKKILGAAVDVYEEEPPSKNHPFFELDNILVTPHIAAMTDGALKRMSIDVCQGVIQCLKGESPKYLFNKEVLRSVDNA